MKTEDIVKTLERHTDKIVAVTSDYKDSIAKLEKIREEYNNSLLIRLRNFALVIWPLLVVITVAALDYFGFPIQISFGDLNVSSCQKTE